MQGACTRLGRIGWRVAVCVILALLILSVFTSSFMKMDSVAYSRTEKSRNAFGFMQEFPFWYSIGIMFLYLCIEATVMGWMVTYYEECGVLAASAAQLLNSLLWITILVGRFGCSAVGGRFSPAAIIRLLSAGILISLSADAADSKDMISRAVANHDFKGCCPAELFREVRPDNSPFSLELQPPRRV